MSFLTILYHLTIYPLELFFEVIYALSNRVINNPGLSIVTLSLAVNFLVLPLYRRVDAIQAEEHDTEIRLKPGLDHIKKTFKGDERFMVLQTFYRQNHYKPTYALKGSLSLLLEIPFFIAAYRFLSGLQLLQGVSFGPIRDLGMPDAMFTLGGFTVNLLPVLMTVINFISGAIYTKGLSFKSKFQLYAMAVVFLVFLYESPSGLVFYWTLNNLFSLVKNAFMKLKNSRLVLAVCSSLLGIALFCGFTFLRPSLLMRRQLFLAIFCLLLQLPALLYLIKPRLPQKADVPASQGNTVLFFLGCFFLTVLTGVLIPSAVIQASPVEFMDMRGIWNPLYYVATTAAVSAGFFVVWMGMFYFLAGSNGRRIMGLLVWIACGTFLVNYMFFSSGFGNLSPELKFDEELVIPLEQQLKNLAALAVVAAVFYAVWRFRKSLVPFACAVGIVAFTVMSAINLVQAGTAISSVYTGAREDGTVVSFPFSQKGKNVVVIMMDRAVGTLVPYLFREKPELKKAFDGFTYYHNTISYGVVTNYGAPALFGGYEYTPEAINRRSDESLAHKHNEALQVMPLIFQEAGYQVTIADQAYAGYSWYPDFSMYDRQPNITAYHIGSSGRYLYEETEGGSAVGEKRKRNFFFYSLFRITPSFLQGTVYNFGLYNAADDNQRLVNPEKFKSNQEETDVPETEGFPAGYIYTGQTADSPSTAIGVKPGFMMYYTALTHLSSISETEPGSQNHFLILDNDTTHEETLLKEPEYIPVARVDNTLFDEENRDRFTMDGITLHFNTAFKMSHYHINMAAYLQLANWFDWMRENHVYDNTRIILVSDHGYPLHLNFAFELPDNTDTTAFHPVLMVKDFNSTGFSVSEEFMTNADTPTLAFEGLIENPVNPATGVPIDSTAKEAGPQHVTFADQWDIEINNGNTFIPGYWYEVQGNTYDPDNWKEIPDPITGEFYREP